MLVLEESPSAFAQHLIFQHSSVLTITSNRQFINLFYSLIDKEIEIAEVYLTAKLALY